MPPPGQRQVSSRPDPLHAPGAHATRGSLPTAVKTAATETWGLIFSSAVEVDAFLSARYRTDHAEAEQEAASANELALRRKTVVAAAQAAADSAQTASARAEKALMRTQAGRIKRQRDSTSSATRSAAAASRTAKRASSVQ